MPAYIIVLHDVVIIFNKVQKCVMSTTNIRLRAQVLGSR